MVIAWSLVIIVGHCVVISRCIIVGHHVAIGRSSRGHWSSRGHQSLCRCCRVSRCCHQWSRSVVIVAVVVVAVAVGRSLVVVVSYNHDCNCHATCRGCCTPLQPLLLQVLLPLRSSLHQVLFLMLLPYVHVIRPLEPYTCTRLGAERADNGQSSKILHEDGVMRGEW